MASIPLITAILVLLTCRVWNNSVGLVDGVGGDSGLGDLAVGFDGLKCDSCGNHCSSVCGSRAFRTCCYHYIKRSGPPPPVPPPPAPLITWEPTPPDPSLSSSFDSASEYGIILPEGIRLAYMEPGDNPLE